MSDSKPEYTSVEPQCIALTGSGDRCTNGSTNSQETLCGTHMNAEDPALGPEEEDREWAHCPHCGWQPVEWAAAGDPPYCSECGVEIPYESPRWSERDE